MNEILGEVAEDRLMQDQLPRTAARVSSDWQCHTRHPRVPDVRIQALIPVSRKSCSIPKSTFLVWKLDKYI